jgi:hypothetical protein
MKSKKQNKPNFVYQVKPSSENNIFQLVDRMTEEEFNQMQSDTPEKEVKIRFGLSPKMEKIKNLTIINDQNRWFHERH